MYVRVCVCVCRITLTQAKLTHRAIFTPRQGVDLLLRDLTVLSAASTAGDPVGDNEATDPLNTAQRRHHKSADFSCRRDSFPGSSPAAVI